MNPVEPLVIKLAETRLAEAGVERLAEHYAALDWLNKLENSNQMILNF